MKLLIDTNVLIKYIIADEKCFEECRNIVERAIDCDDYEIISASAMTDIFYIVNKMKKDSFETQDIISNLLNVIHVATVTEEDIKDALQLRWKDFEDAVQYSVALNNDVDVIVTYNARDFKDSRIPVKSPSEFLKESKDIEI